VPEKQQKTEKKSFGNATEPVKENEEGIITSQAWLLKNHLCFLL
jgi:hypothetical protein